MSEDSPESSAGWLVVDDDPAIRDVLRKCLAVNGFRVFEAVQIGRLRKKLEDHPELPILIRSIRGVGYALAAPVERA